MTRLAALAALASLAASTSALALEPTKAGRAPVRGPADLDALIARHAEAHGVPESLVHRVVQRESRYNPRAIGRGGVFGLMQLKHGTARALGYTGTTAGLLDADTNLAFGVKYLAGAYQVANGNPDRAIAFFARGYYYEAKRRGLAGLTRGKPAAAEAPVQTASVEAAPEPAPEPVLDKGVWESNR